jgi:hypothetical protein
MAQNYIFVRLNTRRLNKYEKQRVERLVENLQRKSDKKDHYVFISLLEWRKIEERIVLRPDLYKNLEVDLVNMPEENIMKGGVVGSEEFMGWLEKLPRSDIFHTEGDIDIDGSAFWDSPDEG